MVSTRVTFAIILSIAELYYLGWINFDAYAQVFISAILICAFYPISYILIRVVESIYDKGMKPSA